MKPFVIVNPMAANRRVGKRWESYRALIEAELGPFDFAKTQSANDAGDIARQALKEGYRTIGSLGGDGTHSLVINGFFEDGEPVAPGARLGILPVGTGGDFRRNLPIAEKDLALYARLMASGESTPIDVGQITYIDDNGKTASRYFLNIASFGLGGLVDRIVNSSTKILGGRLSFVLGSLRGMMRYDAPPVTISVDGVVVATDRLLTGAVCNGRYFGGGMMVAPDAELSDGLFDVIVMPWRNIRTHLLQSGRIYKGTHLDLPGVVAVRGRVVSAECDEECLIDIDGEAPGRLPVEITILPSALQLIGLRGKQGT
jgi:YegS/Rv2252/BmrU family lipid kinase